MNHRETEKNQLEDGFLNILNGLNTQLMVTDPVTGRILFSNDAMNDRYNVAGNPVGKRCWEVYQTGMAGRCPFCAVPRLLKNPGVAIEWEYHNESSSRWFRNQDSIIRWTDGRLAHLQQAVDITRDKLVEQTLSRRLEQQKLMSAISRSFIDTPDMEAFVDDALKMIGEFLGIDRVLLGHIGEARNFVCFEYGWYGGACRQREGSVALVDSFLPVMRAFETWGQNHVTCTDVSRDTHFSGLAENGIASFLSFPLLNEGKIWGSLILETITEPREWVEEDVALGKMVANLTGGILSRLSSLEKISEAETRAQMMLDATPMGCTFFDEDFDVTDCNQEAPRMFGLATKQEYSEKFYNLSPRYQPDGTSSVEKARAMLDRAFESGNEVFEWMHQHVDGSPLPTEVSLVRVKWQGRHRILCYTRDLRQLKATMAEIEKTQTELLQAKERAEESARAKDELPCQHEP